MARRVDVVEAFETSLTPLSGRGIFQSMFRRPLIVAEAASTCSALGFRIAEGRRAKVGEGGGGLRLRTGSDGVVWRGFVLPVREKARARARNDVDSGLGLVASVTLDELRWSFLLGIVLDWP